VADQPSRLRSRRWFDNPADPAMTALYIERYMNYGIIREELQTDKPVIGIAQTGSDLAPCNRHHLQLAERVRDGIRTAGGIPLEFPVHSIQETGKRPTAALDRNLAYLGLVEVLHGCPLDGVVLTTGCDKTTPAYLMAAATVNIPAIGLSGDRCSTAGGRGGWPDPARSSGRRESCTPRASSATTSSCSWLNTMPRRVNISGRSRRASL
jgi:dihydroxy-acid dehydratase